MTDTPENAPELLEAGLVMHGHGGMGKPVEEAETEDEDAS